MMIAIVAVDDNLSIGSNNKLLFKISKDQKFFRNKTMGKCVIMGSNTYESLGRKPLKGRINIVITRDPDKYKNDDIYAFTYEKFIKKIDELDDIKSSDMYIIGGAQIYKLLYDDTDEVYLTTLHRSYDDTDAHFWNIYEDDNFKNVELIDSGLYRYSLWTITRWVRK